MAATIMQCCTSAARRAMVASRSAILSSPPSSTLVPILCGRGDKRTKKGKRFNGSYGNARPKKEKKIERIKDRVEVPRCYLSSFLIDL
ncbi:hypothetical protein K2173_002449 [Erythroxylum novogranatense]|uniref:30S ribosomal protein S31, mitochondrial n=1 Tax=Erythroxylum novogranatense TaxID=1862640 RepID=A0AAV8T9Y9_9ROSI|nr:hypothetical protein K2173_002449 [Erythroxylum novogranatense]